MIKTKKLRWLWILLAMTAACGMLCAAIPLGINGYVVGSTQNRILSPEAAAQIEDVDCILVLGCGVWDENTPSPMLRDRLLTAMDLFDRGAAPKLLMTGDHGRVNYNEVSVMKNFAMEAGAASQDVFMDHAGFSTYESLYRARDVFQAKKIIIVTQKYHLYRALNIADALGIEAYGVSADLQRYAGQSGRELREVLARCKDFATGILQPKPTYLGEAIPIWGDGDLTND